MESDSKQQNLIIVNNEKCVRDYLATICRRLGFAVAVARSPEMFLSKLAAQLPDVIIVDVDLSETDTMSVLKAASEKCSDASIVLISGNDSRNLSRAKDLVALLGLTVIGALQKPVLIDSLRTVLSKTARTATPAQADELHLALKKGEIRPAYQAKAVQSMDGSWALSEVEALARWHRADGVTAFPSQFIEVAEECGLLGTLTWTLLKQVALQMRDWDNRGHAITTSINLPPSLLSEPAFPSALQKLMQKHMLDNSKLTLELAETAAMQNPGLTMGVLEKLHAMGFGLSIDKFGAGYSSIEQLYRLPFTELKIDRYLVRELGYHPDAARIVKAIVMLGQQLQMSVCAEGVESPKVLDHLLDIGCDKLQGYFIARPGPAERIETQIRRFHRSGFTPEDFLTTEKRTSRTLPILCQ